MLGGAATVLGPLAASAAFGVVLATAGPLEGAATPVRAHSGEVVVRLLLVDLAVVSGSGEDWQHLLVVVDGDGAPVGLVSQGRNVLIVVLGELQADCNGKAA